MDQSPENTKVKKPFYKKPLGCLLTLAIAAVLGLVLLYFIAIWAIPSIASSFIKGKTGAELSVKENNISPFSGRFDWRGVKLTNSERFQEKAFLDFNQITAQVDLQSLSTDTIVIPEVTIDIEQFVFVGKGRSSINYHKDNNIISFAEGFSSGDSAKETTAPEEKKAPATAKEPVHFHINKLTLKLNTLRAIINDGSDSPGELIPATNNVLSLEFTDVTDENINSKVFSQIDSVLGAKGLGVAVFATANAIFNEGVAALETVGEAAGQAVDKAGEVVNKAGDAVNKAGEAASGAVKGAADAIGGLFGGDKKDGEKK